MMVVIRLTRLGGEKVVVSLEAKGCPGRSLGLENNEMWGQRLDKVQDLESGSQDAKHINRIQDRQGLFIASPSRGKTIDT